MNHSHIELHEKALALATQFRNTQSALIDILQQIDRDKVYRSYHCSSLYEYAQLYLKLSEDVAATLIKIARLSKKIPELKEEIQKGEMTTSNARLIAPVLEKILKSVEPNQQESIAATLDDAKSLTKRELEKKIAAQNPELAVRESVHYVNAERMKMTLRISEELFEKLRRVQDLEAQRLRRHVTLEEALEASTDEYLHDHDPIEKAKRAQKRQNKKIEQSTSSTHNISPAPGRTSKPSTISTKREPISAQTEHELQLRLGGRCAHVHPEIGLRCRERRWLDIHHIKPVSEGGTNDLFNLTLLCRGHHEGLHEVA